MKKSYLLLVVLVALLSSCDDGSFEDSIANPERSTTVELLSMDRDTFEVVTVDDRCYFIKDELVVAKAYWGGPDVAVVQIGFIFFMLGAVVIGFVIGVCID